MAVVDIHVHIYPEKIAAKAAESVGEFYRVPMAGDGTADVMRSLGASSPITHCVVHSVAVKPKNVESINDFIAASCDASMQEGAPTPRLIGFMTMHQDFDDPAAEIERAVGMGLRGIKLHPDMQRVDLDDPRFMRVYDIAQQMHLPVIIHCGDYRTDYSHPRRLVHVLHEFPQLVVDAAHFGGWSVPDLALEYLEKERCFLDVSSSMAYIGKRRTLELCRAHGCDRMLFGSDYPMWDPAREYRFFSECGFSDDEFEAMTWHNAERFLNMPIA